MSGLDNTSMTVEAVGGTGGGTAYTATNQDYVILVSPVDGAFTVTIPDPTTVQPGRPYYVHRDDTATNTVTLATDGSSTINGAATFEVGAAGAYGSCRVVSDGTNWFVIAEY